jgi:hypothetical protein
MEKVTLSTRGMKKNSIGSYLKKNKLHDYDPHLYVDVLWMALKAEPAPP